MAKSTDTLENNNTFFFEKEHKNFLNSDLYKRLDDEFEHLIVDTIYDISTGPPPPIQSGASIPSLEWHRKDEFNDSVMFYSHFIYLNSIINKSHSKIADIGCGINFLKNYFPNVIGYDRENCTDPDGNYYADVVEEFDDKFIENHVNEFDVAVAINSLHFISLRDFAERINDFGKVIKPRGYGFITFNVQRMIRRTSQEVLQEFNTTKDFYDYFNQEMEKINYEVIAYDNLLLYNKELIKKNKHTLYKTLYKNLCGVDWPSLEDILNDAYTCMNRTISDEVEIFKKTISTSTSNTLSQFDDPMNGVIRIIIKT